MINDFKFATAPGGKPKTYRFIRGVFLFGTGNNFSKSAKLHMERQNKRKFALNDEESACKAGLGVVRTVGSCGAMCVAVDSPWRSDVTLITIILLWLVNYRHDWTTEQHSILKWNACFCINHHPPTWFIVI